MLSDLFAAPMIAPDTDDTRTCGSCLQQLTLDNFYSDGKDRDGNPRYRRDCKGCYKTTRVKTKKAAEQARVAATRPSRKPGRKRR